MERITKETKYETWLRKYKAWLKRNKSWVKPVLVITILIWLIPYAIGYIIYMLYTIFDMMVNSIFFN